MELSLYCSIPFEVRRLRVAGEKKFLKIISRVWRKPTFSSLEGRKMGEKGGFEGGFGKDGTVTEDTSCLLDERGRMR